MPSALPLSVTVVVPGLVPAAADLWPDALSRLPALRRLLARSGSFSRPSDHLEALLLSAFGVQRQHDWPVAPFTLLADGGDPGESVWLRADPTHLLLQQTQLTLVEPEHLRLSAEERTALLDTVNRHFAHDGLSFHAPHPQRWYLRVPRALQLQSTPPHEVVGRSVERLLPQGADALLVHAWFNELQMLLHDHPVNAAREARQALAVNSLWFWGAGRMVRPQPSDPCEVWTDDPLLLGLARASALPVHRAPDHGTDWLTSAPRGAHWIELRLLARPEARADLHAWLARAELLERSWFSPLLAALRARQLRRLVLVTQHEAQALQFSVGHSDLWKLWRQRVSA